MYAVIFEVKVKPEGKDQYLDIAAKLKAQLVQMDGFISIERFSSLVEEEKILSLSFWESKESIAKWKANMDHMQAQQKGRMELFEDYRIRLAEVFKDYTMETSDANY
jgi:heme-degrading monooxygenase HmoA